MKWVRPGVVIALIGTAIVGFLTGKFESEFMSSLITGLAVYWFRSRDTEKVGKKD